jgi:phage terminase large subunit-like protein
VTATIDLVRPRILSAPPAVSSSGDEISDFAARFGLVLVPWQRLALRTAMAERADGRWAAGRVAIIVPRQNGKGTIIEARELGGLFLLGEKMITHTAHEFKTAQDAFRRIRTIIDGSDERQPVDVRGPLGWVGAWLRRGRGHSG